MLACASQIGRAHDSRPKKARDPGLPGDIIGDHVIVKELIAVWRDFGAAAFGPGPTRLGYSDGHARQSKIRLWENESDKNSYFGKQCLTSERRAEIAIARRWSWHPTRTDGKIAWVKLSCHFKAGLKLVLPGS